MQKASDASHMSQQQKQCDVSDDRSFKPSCPIPREDSHLVLAQKEILLGTLNMQAIVEGLDHVGKFIYIAYTCIGAGGPEFQTFQNRIQKLGFETVTLLNSSASAVNQFKSTSQDMLFHLEDAYNYLIEGHTHLSIQRLAILESLAKESGSVAKSLSLQFEEHKQKVCTDLQITLDEKAQQDYERKCTLQNEEDNRTKKMMEEHYQLKEAEQEKKLQTLKENEDNSLYDKFLIVLSFGSPLDNMELVQIQQIETMSYVECLHKIKSFLTKPECNSIETELVSISSTALYNASQALNFLHFVMLQVANYWSQLQKYCAKLSSSYIRKDIETFNKFNPQVKPWKSPTFNAAFMKFCAQFVALQSVCTDFLEKLKPIQKDLNLNVSQILTYEEARQILKDLSEKFI